MSHALAKSYATGEYRMKYRLKNGQGQPWHDEWTKTVPWTADPDLPTVIHDLEAYIDVLIRDIFDCKGHLIPEIRETWRPHCDAQGNALLDTATGDPLGQRLGIVGPSYTVLQDHEVVNWFKPWVESGVATIETGGAMFGGTRFWVLARLKKDAADVVPGDPIEQYVLAINGHDGTLAFRGFPTTVRVVCNNTAQVALASSLARRFRRKHNTKIHMRVEEVRAEVESMDALFLGNLNKFKALAGANVKSADDLKAFFQMVLKEKVDVDKKIKDDGKRPLPTLIRLFEDGVGNNLKGVNGTYWAAYNAVTEFTTHLRSRNSDARLDNMLTGSGGDMINRALNIGLKAADGKLMQAAA